MGLAVRGLVSVCIATYKVINNSTMYRPGISVKSATHAQALQ